MNHLQDLIEISRYYGRQKEYTLAGGGNTSYKNEQHIWVKASGENLADINEDGFTVLDRKKVKLIGMKTYSKDLREREKQVKEDLLASKTDIDNPRRPSVETSLHELLEYSYIVHLHPTLVNALTCSNNAEKVALELFGEEVMFTGYAAGYQLFKNVQSEITSYRDRYGKDPKIILMKNHGVFVSAESISEIKDLYKYITDKIKSKLPNLLKVEEFPVRDDITTILPAIRMIISEDKPRILKIRNNNLISYYYTDNECFAKASMPFTPDIIVYCKGKYIYINDSSSPENIIASFSKQLTAFKKDYNFSPHIVVIKDYGVIAAGDNALAAETAMDVYEDLLKISYYSEAFGGPHFLNKDNIAFIDNWEVESYRRQIAKGMATRNETEQKIVIVTGGAQGFGEGIAESFVKNNANVIISDLNEETGKKTCERLRSMTSKNQVYYVKTDVTSGESVKHLMLETIKRFGGLDVLISNAGILKAGGLEEMDQETFAIMTKVNYEGYFLTVKYASEILKIQASFREDYFTDIIQINSKSGLKGSNKNFTYAGSKFGGIGLTQSFALELAPYRIKVNSICPGNFFEGPLWADPEKGLFIQYLWAGKIKGAKTIDDVKKYYEEQVPMGRGCKVGDVMKAILYLISQEYETGQAIPVTGGQIMLG